MNETGTETVNEISQPNGGFQWKAHWTKLLPIVRGVHVPSEPQARVEDLVVLPPYPQITFGQTPDYYWRPEQARERLTLQALAQRDAGYWVELLRQFQHCHGLLENWALHRCLALHGPAFGIEVLDRFIDTLDPGAMYWRKSSWWSVLRQAIAQASDADHDAALRVASELHAAGGEHLVRACYLFPHIAEWTAEALAQHAWQPDALEWLFTCAMTPTAAQQCLKGLDRFSFERLQSGVLLQVRMHGTAALGLVAEFARLSTIRLKKEQAPAFAILSAFEVPGMLPLLTRHLGNDLAVKALEKLGARYPAAVLHALLCQPGWRFGEPLAQRLAAKHPDALRQALEALDPEARQRAQPALAASQAAQASKSLASAAGMPPALAEEPLPESLPALLREPPWLRTRQKPLPTVAVTPILTEEQVVFSASEREQALSYEPRYAPGEMPTSGFDESLYLTETGVARLLQGQELQAGDVAEPRYGCAMVSMVLRAPERARLALWNSYPSHLWMSWLQQDAVCKLVAQYGTAAIPGLCRVATTFPVSGFEMALAVDSPRLVEPALHTIKHHKRGRANAQTWLRAHPRTALLQALPIAFQPKASKARDNARHGLRWLLDQGHEALAREAAAAYGPAMSAALEAFMTLDPLLELPGKIPPLPDFVMPRRLPAPQLADGALVPPAAVAHIATMLAISALDAPYAGLEVLKRSCTPASLAELAWGLFQAWLDAGVPPKEKWAFAALGLLGDDETARRLSPLIRSWPSEGASARAVQGLELLGAIGSDVALMHLAWLASKAKTSGLGNAARNKMQAIADARDLSPEQLADRLVPRLGLDEASALTLDFGPRRFTLHFDETLKPFVKDESGKRLKDLPKPVQADDAWRANAATARFKQVKKDAKMIAGQQVARLERAMVERRRWSGQEFRSLFLEHPVLRHLAARLAWGTYEGGTLQQCFRVAEDWTLADAQDSLFALDDAAVVGIPHPVEMAPALLQALADIFADYEILQPFKQLGRETYALTHEERAGDALTRYKDKVLVCASVLGLTTRGWMRTGADSGGWVSDLARPLGELSVRFRMEPGTLVGNPLHEPRQRIPAVQIHAQRYAPGEPRATFALLDPIQASEVLRDLELLPITKD